MARLSFIRISLLSGCAAIVGGASLLTYATARIAEPDGLTGLMLSRVPAVTPAVQFNFPICHGSATTTATARVIRLAQTEVSPGGLPAVMPAPEFADSEPPLWEGLGSITYKITTSNNQAQA